MLRSNAPILQKTAKRKIVRHPSKLSNILVIMKLKQNEQLAEELHKPVIRKFYKRKANFSSKDNIWGADLAAIHLTRKFNKGSRF